MKQGSKWNHKITESHSQSQSHVWFLRDCDRKFYWLLWVWFTFFRLVILWFMWFLWFFCDHKMTFFTVLRLILGIFFCKFSVVGKNNFATSGENTWTGREQDLLIFAPPETLHYSLFFIVAELKLKIFSLRLRTPAEQLRLIRGRRLWWT